MAPLTDRLHQNMKKWFLWSLFHRNTSVLRVSSGKSTPCFPVGSFELQAAQIRWSRVEKKWLTAVEVCESKAVVFQWFRSDSSDGSSSPVWLNSSADERMTDADFLVPCRCFVFGCSSDVTLVKLDWKTTTTMAALCQSLLQSGLQCRTHVYIYMYSTYRLYLYLSIYYTWR